MKQRIRLRNGGCRPKAFWGAIVGSAIGAGSSILGSIFGGNAQKKAMEEQARQQRIANNRQFAQQFSEMMQNETEAQDSFYDMHRVAAKNGVSVKGKRKLKITDGGDLIPLTNDGRLALVTGATHDQINESGKTGVGLKKGKTNFEAQNGEVVYDTPNNTYVLSDEIGLGKYGGSPAKEVLEGVPFNEEYMAQERNKKRLGIRPRRIAETGGEFNFTNYSRPNRDRKGKSDFFNSLAQAQFSSPVEKYGDLITAFGRAIDALGNQDRTIIVPQAKEMVLPNPSTGEVVQTQEVEQPLKVKKGNWALDGVYWGMPGSKFKTWNVRTNSRTPIGSLRTFKVPNGYNINELVNKYKGHNPNELLRYGDALSGFGIDMNEVRKVSNAYNSKDIFTETYKDYYNILRKGGDTATDARRLASLLTAQDMFESDWGRSRRAKEDNNLGGMEVNKKSIKYNDRSAFRRNKVNLLDRKWKAWRNANSYEGFAEYIHPYGGQMYSETKDYNRRLGAVGNTVNKRLAMLPMLSFMKYGGKISDRPKFDGGGYVRKIKGKDYTLERPKDIQLDMPSRAYNTYSYLTIGKDGNPVINNVPNAVLERQKDLDAITQRVQSGDTSPAMTRGTNYYIRGGGNPSTLASLAGAGINAAGSIISGLINNAYINRLQSPTAPILLNGAGRRLRIGYNIRPQLAELDRNYFNTRNDLSRETASSAAYLDRIGKLGLSTTEAKNKLWAEKENIETQQFNENAKLQNDNDRLNIGLYNDYLNKVTDFNNNVTQARANNWTNTIQGVFGSGVDMFDRMQQNYEDTQAQLAYIAGAQPGSVYRLARSGYRLPNYALANLAAAEDADTEESRERKILYDNLLRSQGGYNRRGLLSRLLYY